MNEVEPRDVVRIVIIEDEDVFLVGLKSVLRAELQVVGCAQDPIEGVELIRGEKPQLVLLDLRFPNSSKDGHWVLQQVHKMKDRPLVIVLSAFNTPEIQAKVKSQGAVAFLHKLDSTDRIVATIHEVARGARPRFVEAAPGFYKLTPREIEIIKVLSETRGSDQDIADLLGIQQNTISKSFSMIRLKLGLSNRTDIVAWYLRAFPDLSG